MDTFKKLIFLLLIALTALSAFAGDVLTLANGDRLNGRLLREDEENYYFDSELLGLIVVKKEQSAVADKVEDKLRQTPQRRIPRARYIPDAQREDFLGNILPDQTPEIPPVVAVPPFEPAAAPLVKKTLFEIPHPVIVGMERFVDFITRIYPLRDWRNKLDIGIIYQRNDLEKVDYNFNFSSELNNPDTPSSYLITLRRDYGWQRNQSKATSVNKDRVRTGFRYRYAFDKNYFGQSLSQYNRDMIKGIRHDYDQSFGVGYKWLSTPNWTGSVTPSAGGRYRNLIGEEYDFSWSVGIIEELTYKVNTRLTINQQLSLAIDPLNTEDFSAYFNGSIQNKLTDRIHLRMRYEYSYDGNVAIGRTPNHHTVSFGVGTEF